MKITPLRLARLQQGLTMDLLQVRSAGELRQSRISQIERGLAKPTPREVEWFVKLVGVDAAIMTQ
jgi:transcriptional regulator with XRE-family HTH domain